VRDAGRQVQHVAGFEQPLVGGLELGELLQLHIRAELSGRHRIIADGPVALTQSLQQKHVVLIHVRAHATTGLGVGHHHIVHAPAGQKTEGCQQAGDIGVPFVHVLHQQCPVAVRRAGEVGLAQRAGVDVPAVALFVVHDQTRQRCRFAGETGQVVGLQGRPKVRERVADQQRALLPVVAQEAGSAHAERTGGAAAHFDGEMLDGGHADIVIAPVRFGAPGR
jgi:hypothetical protein